MTGQQIVIKRLFDGFKYTPSDLSKQFLDTLKKRASSKEVNYDILEYVRKAFYRKINRRHLDAIEIIGGDDKIAYGFGPSEIWGKHLTVGYMPMAVETDEYYVNLINLTTGQIRQEKL